MIATVAAEPPPAAAAGGLGGPPQATFQGGGITYCFRRTLNVTYARGPAKSGGTPGGHAILCRTQERAMAPEKPKLPTEAIELYNRYIHGEVGRRDFLDGV